MIQINQTTRAKLFLADDTTVIIELAPQEIQLLNLMRNKYRYGKLDIFVQHGFPVRVEKVTESIDLTKPLDTTVR